MKFRVTMKDPDTLWDACNDAAKEFAKDSKVMEALSDDTKEATLENIANDFNDVASKWFAYGEYLTVEIDTEAKTCVVVPKGD